MRNSLKLFAAAIIATGVTTPAIAGVPAGVTVPFGEGGMLGLVAAGIVAGVWLARRKR